MIHYGTQRIETEHLVLRPFREQDAQDVFTLLSDEAVTRYLIFKPHENVDRSRAVLREWIPQYAKAHYYNWAITEAAQDRVIGNIYLIHLSEDICKVELGYHLARPFWNKNYVSEAVRAILHFFFEQVGVHKVTARYDARNPASGRVLEKNGFQREGILRREAFVNAGIGDWIMMGLLYEEYLLQFGQDQ